MRSPGLYRAHTADGEVRHAAKDFACLLWLHSCAAVPLSQRDNFCIILQAVDPIRAALTYSHWQLCQQHIWRFCHHTRCREGLAEPGHLCQQRVHAWCVDYSTRLNFKAASLPQSGVPETTLCYTLFLCSNGFLRGCFPECSLQRTSDWRLLGFLKKSPLA